MPAYLVLHGVVKDPEAMARYSQGVAPLLAEHGAKRIVRGAKADRLAGNGPDDPVSILEFPSREAVQAFFDAPEYRTLKPHREAGADINMWVVEGSD